MQIHIVFEEGTELRILGVFKSEANAAALCQAHINADMDKEDKGDTPTDFFFRSFTLED